MRFVSLLRKISDWFINCGKYLQWRASGKSKRFYGGGLGSWVLPSASREFISPAFSADKPGIIKLDDGKGTLCDMSTRKGRKIFNAYCKANKRVVRTYSVIVESVMPAVLGSKPDAIAAASDIQADKPAAGESLTAAVTEVATLAPDPDRLVTQCSHCCHFIEENTAYKGEPGIAKFVHVDAGEQEYSHEADPGITKLLSEWKISCPDLFKLFADGKAGPNSAHYEAWCRRYEHHTNESLIGRWRP